MNSSKIAALAFGLCGIMLVVTADLTTAAPVPPDWCGTFCREAEVVRACAAVGCIKYSLPCCDRCPGTGISNCDNTILAGNCQPVQEFLTRRTCVCDTICGCLKPNTENEAYDYVEGKNPAMLGTPLEPELRDRCIEGGISQS